VDAEFFYVYAEWINIKKYCFMCFAVKADVVRLFQALFRAEITGVSYSYRCT
jgi:hypothetical protein